MFAVFIPRSLSLQQYLNDIKDFFFFDRSNVPGNASNNISSKKRLVRIIVTGESQQQHNQSCNRSNYSKDFRCHTRVPFSYSDRLCCGGGKLNQTNLSYIKKASQFIGSIHVMSVWQVMSAFIVVGRNSVSFKTWIVLKWRWNSHPAHGRIQSKTAGLSYDTTAALKLLIQV